MMNPTQGGYHPGQGTCIGHEPCPKCRKNGKDRTGDNLARYDDGHAWCFSCGYRESSTATQMLEKAFKHMHKEQVKPDEVKYSDPNADPSRERTLGDPVSWLPNDAGKSIAAYALKWLAKYGINRDEIIRNDIRWSDFRSQLIFPIRAAGGGLLAFVGRNFSPNDPKWRTYGKVNGLIHLIHPTPVVVGLEDPIVVVEDIVSAIKVGRHVCAVPLFGSHCGPDKLGRLRGMTKKIIFWLDPDKYVDAMSASKRAQMVGMESYVIYSEKDPKDHTDAEILNYVRI